jgi:hypothetical protein
MKLCTIKNIIQLSNLELHDLGNKFSRQDLRDSVFQDSIIKFICLGECFKTLIKEKSGLHDDADVTERLIPVGDILQEQPFSFIRLGSIRDIKYCDESLSR